MVVSVLQSTVDGRGTAENFGYDGRFRSTTAMSPVRWAGEEGWDWGRYGLQTGSGVMTVKNEEPMTLIVIIVNYVLGLVRSRTAIRAVRPEQDRSCDTLRRGDAAFSLVVAKSLAPPGGLPPNLPAYISGPRRRSE